MSTKIFQTRESIRVYMRTIRKSLNVSEQYNASIKISQIAFDCQFIYNSKNVAIFLPFDGEINTYPLILKLWHNKKKVFLPIIRSFNEKKMSFVHFTNNSILYYNKYKILEPFFKLEDVISTYNLDVVIVPLVAFDKIGSRLGMGGGFYDSCLRNWKKKKFVPVGFSYSFQFIHNIPKQHWDISLPIVLTPYKIWFF